MGILRAMSKQQFPGTAADSLAAKYGVPRIDHGEIMADDLAGEAIHKLDIGNGRSLDWYAKLAPASELYVTLQGAVPSGKDRYPRFQRVASMRERVPAFIAISDPTFTLNDDEEMRIGWYAGGAAWDPLPEIAHLIRQIMDRIGAEHVAFIGGSAGGHGALRISPLFPRSLALVTDPQTNVMRYTRPHREKFFEAGWPGEGSERVFAADPQRFDMCQFYAAACPDNFVFYRQSTRDVSHVRDQATPFMDVFEMEGSTSTDGRRHFAFEEGIKPGHGAITAEEFDRVFADAVSFWRERRDLSGEVPAPPVRRTPAQLPGTRLSRRTIDPATHTVYSSMHEFKKVGARPSGTVTVMDGGLPIDIRHDDRGYDVTTVIFHAALSSKATRYPVFMGASITEDMPTNRIFISDPSLYINETLRLAWYAGNRKQPKLQWTLRSILNTLIPKHHRVVTFGPSGGGFAALYFATKFAGATAVPVNPQTDLAMYLPSEVARYAEQAWGITGKDALGQIPSVTNLAPLYRAAPETRAFYVQNRNDVSHVNRHLTPFLEALPGGHSVHPVLLEGEAGHKPPPREPMRAVLAAAVGGAETPPEF